MPTFELIPEDDQRLPDAAPGQPDIGKTVLLHNARWFVQIRWMAAGVLLVSATMASVAPGLARGLGLQPPPRWPWVFGAVLAAVNALFAWLVRQLSDSHSSQRAVAGNLWLQIVVDLLAVTALVHLVGSTTTFIACIYLFHIVLACIFFSRRNSLVVALLAAFLYLGCVGLEVTDVIPRTSVLTSASVPPALPLPAVHAFSALLVWFVTWYLVSTLSEKVRRRDDELAAANEELRQADQEKNRLVLRVTHDLKAPFAGIENNIEILKLQHWDELNDPIRTLIQKIEKRSETLRRRINDILLLGELRSGGWKAAAGRQTDLGVVLTGIVRELEEKAHERQVTVDVHVPSARIAVDGQQLSVLFSNIISNAVTYSHEGGRVEISTTQNETEMRVAVTDHGIGIETQSLPRMFDEYFRGKEAARINPASTGLGLAIVKQIAQNLGLRIIVNSEKGMGTTFEVVIPKQEGG